MLVLILLLKEDPLDTIPISQFEHRVAKWAARLKRERKPLRITQRGETTLVVFPKDLFVEWAADREKTQALELRLLIAAGERDFALGRYHTHEEVGRMLGLTGRKKKTRR